MIEFTADRRRCQVTGDEQQSGPAVCHGIGSCKPKQRGIPIDTQPANVRDAGGEAQQGRAGARAALQNAVAGSGGNSGGKQYRVIAARNPSRGCM